MLLRCCGRMAVASTSRAASCRAHHVSHHIRAARTTGVITSRNLIHAANSRRTAVCRAEAGSLYSQPELYDRMFSFDRDFQQEVNFLFEVFTKHNGREPHNFAELGCGPARHSRLLAARGLSGYAIDNSENMMQLVSCEAKADGVSLNCITADMRQPFLPAGETVDVVIMLFNTIAHLRHNDDAIACFQAVAASLNPGGLFVVECVHLEDMFDGCLEIPSSWEVPADEHGPELHMQYDGEEFDVVTQLIKRSIVVTEKDSKEVLARDTIEQRLFGAQEFDLLGRLTGLQVVGNYGGLSVPFTDPIDYETLSHVVVFRQTETRG